MAELESVRTIARGVDAGLGATITPKAIADRIVAESKEEIVVRRIASPMIEETLSFCVSDNTPLSEPALAVKEILLQLAETLK